MDRWFFRDGRAFNQGESNQLLYPSLFPPTPRTVVGAIRAAAARALGWDETVQKRWDSSITDKLGDGDDLNTLAFSGPYLAVIDTDEKLLAGATPPQLLYPVPATLLGEPPTSTIGVDDETKEPWVDLIQLAPGPKHYCDLGEEIHLPVYSAGDGVDGRKHPSRSYLTGTDLRIALEGETELGESVKPIAQKALWQTEPRVGIDRDPETRTTGEHALFSTNMVQPATSIGLVMKVEGLDDDIALGEMAPLGGESKLAFIDEIGDDDEDEDDDAQDQLEHPAPPTLLDTDGTIRFTLYCVTPTRFAHWPTPAHPPELPGVDNCRLITACLGKPFRIGGWDSRNYEPLPLQPFAPAGSVLFFEAPVTQRAAVEALHGTKLGEGTAFGYGEVLLGTWTDDFLEA